MDDVSVERSAPLISVAEIRERVRAHARGGRVIRAIVFGSFARGDADASSDIDLVLIEPTSDSFVERGLRHLALFDLGVGVDLLVYTPEEYERLQREKNPLIERIESEGVTLYARS
jgi:predicted nucleotidyltransferase